MPLKKKLISIVIPSYNEEENIPELHKKLSEVFIKNSKYNFEIILVENGSTDNSFEIANKISKKDNRLKILKLSRNFGCDGAITAGLNIAQGDAAVIMVADLQDPPELITKFLEKWEEGYENIYQIVQKRTGSSWIRKFNSKIFYYIVNVMTGGMVPKNVSDYRLVDKKVYKTINEMKERNRFIRGLFAWSGFKSIGIPFKRPERFAGKSKAHTLVVLSLALKGIFAHSYIPLQIITWIGITVSIFAFSFLGIMTLKVLLYGVPFPGYGSIMGVMLLMFGFLFTFLGVIGKYVGLIYEEVKSRPNYVISQTVGIDEIKK